MKYQKNQSKLKSQRMIFSYYWATEMQKLDFDARDHWAGTVGQFGTGETRERGTKGRLCCSIVEYAISHSTVMFTSYLPIILHCISHCTVMITSYLRKSYVNYFTQHSYVDFVLSIIMIDISNCTVVLSSYLPIVVQATSHSVVM